MRLFLIRHAEAEPDGADDARPLTAGGVEQARALAEWLAAESLDAVVSSPLLRARQTAEPIAEASALTAEVDERLSPGASADDMRAAAAGRGPTVALVAHQPDCSQAALALLGHDPGFPPAGVALVDLPE